MRRACDFLVKTAMSGLFILLPLLLLQLMVSEILPVLTTLAEPITSIFLPKAWIEAINAPVVMAIVLIFLVSLALGLLARTRVGRCCGQWLERNTVGRLPLYGVLKNLTARLTEIGEGGSAFKPALLVREDGQRELAYMVEDHADGFATIMVPEAPTPFSGRIRIVPMKQLVMLDASLGDLTRVLSHWGTGARALVSARAMR